MRIKQTLEYHVEASVRRDDENIYIVVTDIESDGDVFHSAPEFFQVIDNQEGFDGIDDGYVLDVIPLDQVPDDYTDEEALDAYFNSPYGLA